MTNVSHPIQKAAAQADSNPGSLIETMKAHLQGELLAHQDMLKLGEAKTAALVAVDKDQLDKVVVEENQRLKTMKALRQNRDRLIRTIGQHLGKQQGLKLSDIIAAAPESLGNELTTLQRSLKSCCEKLNQVNDRNQMLMRTKLSLIHDILDVVVGQASQEQYTGQGQEAERSHGKGGLVNLSA